MTTGRKIVESTLKPSPAPPPSSPLEEFRAALPWCPHPGPQALAFLSDADELYFGGAAGGGKSQLLIGLGLLAHGDTLILRRRAVDAKALSKALQSLNYGSWKWSGSGGELRTPDGRSLEVGGCEHEDDKTKYQGNPHDLIAFDALAPNSEWRFGPRSALRLDPRLRTNSVEAAIAAAIADVGIARVFSYQVREHIAAGRLSEILAERAPPPVSISLLFQANRQTSPNVRAFIDAVKSGLGRRLG